MLCAVFGFAETGDHLSLGDQRIALVKGPAASHGIIDHIALSVPDLEAAAAQIQARGALLDPAVTPHGPNSIPEFWTKGVRYLFLQGPQGARIELIQNLGDPRPIGHDHIGIPCSDIEKSAAFFMALGARPVASAALTRPEGITEVRFLAVGPSVLELYQPPRPVAAAPIGHWHRLLIKGAPSAIGPDGLLIAPL